MLKKLQIKNFKGWEDTGEIRMAPITLFFGANSSGKSSIGQFLMMLKQTVESFDLGAVLFPGGNRSAVQLGSFRDMVHHHDLRRRISFSYQWDLESEISFVDPISRSNFRGSELHFEAIAGIGESAQSSIELISMSYRLIEANSEVLRVGMERQDKGGYKMVSEGFVVKRRQEGRKWSLGAPRHFYAFPDRVGLYHQNADSVPLLNLEHEKLFSSLFYLGPLRTKTDRLYPSSETKPESVGYSGENTIMAMIAANHRWYNFSENQRKKQIEGVVASELKNMGLLEDISIKRIPPDRREYEVKVRTRGSLDLVDLPDVGFGISQVLPVLVQCFYAPRNSIIIMEQPEIHLHPSAQSALADVMIDVIKSREAGENRNIQLIIETHSEHFLRRLQRRIAEGVITAQQVAAYFADTSKSSATLEPLQIDMFGNISNWPEDFFGDQMEDITEQSKSALKKRIEMIESSEAESNQ